MKSKEKFTMSIRQKHEVNMGMDDIIELPQRGRRLQLRETEKKESCRKLKLKDMEDNTPPSFEFTVET